jgi:CubicO group peptidase (beta-lactamase class C family)
MKRTPSYLPPLASFLLFVGLATPAAATSTLSVASVSGTGSFGQGGDVTTWPSDPAGWSFARTYTSGGNTYVVLLRQHTGELEIYGLGANSIGSLVSTYNLRSWWTSAEVFTSGSGPTLVLHDADTGSIRTYVLNSNGTLGTRNDTYHSSWINKNLFSVYQQGSTWYFYGLDTMTGSTTLFTSAGSQVTTSSVTTGWTQMDFTKIGSDTFRVLYKGGDYPGNEGGRLRIDRVDSSGNIAATPVSEAAAESAEGWTTVEFYNANGTTYLIFYNASTSATTKRRIAEFDGTGLTAVTPSFAFDSGWTDFEPYTIGGTTYMLTLNEEGVERINGKELDAIVDAVTAEEPNLYAGYQFAIAQSGRPLYIHTWGSRDLGNSSPGDELPMLRDSYQNVGSVSKVITAMSVLKLADMGEIDLDTPQRNYLDYDNDPGFYDGIWAIHADNEQWTSRDYMKHATNIVEESTGPCGANSAAGPQDISGCLAASTGGCSVNSATGGLNCGYVYRNSGFIVLRSVIEYISLTTGTGDLVDFVRDLWMDRVGLSLSDCLVPAGIENVAHQCTSGTTPCTSWTRTSLADSAHCSSGGWKATPREMLRFARAIRYQHIIGPELTEALMSTTTTTGNGANTALGFDGDIADDKGAEIFQCKNGGVIGWGTNFCVGDGSVDLYIAANQSGSGISMPDLVSYYDAGN